MRTDWTNEEDEFLKQNFLKWYDAAIAEELGRTESSIRSRAARLGLSKKNGTFDDFADDDIAFIKKHYQTMHTKIIAEHLGISEARLDDAHAAAEGDQHTKDLHKVRLFAQQED